MEKVTRVAISAGDNSGLDSLVSPHFGRCPYYALVDIDGRDVKQVNAIANPYYEQHAPGVVPGFIHDQRVDIMLTGGMGRRAIGFFQEYGIEAVTGASGTVRDALEEYLGGRLQGAAPCHESVEHAPEEIPAEGVYERDEAGRLREEVEMLEQQLAKVQARLERL